MRYQINEIRNEIRHATMVCISFKLKALVYAGLLTCGLCTAVQCQLNIEIEGKVVDENNQPVERATVSWEYEPRIDTVSVVEMSLSYESIYDGSFGFVAKWLPGRKIRVFFESPFGRGKEDPVDVTSEILWDYTSDKSRVIDDFRDEVDLGSVSEIIQYGLVRIDMSNAAPEIRSKIATHNIFLSIFTMNRKMVSNVSINTAYSSDDKLLEFRIPEGEWTIKLTDDENAGREIFCRQIFVIRNTGIDLRY